MGLDVASLTAKPYKRDVLPISQDKFDHVDWNHL